MRRTSFQFLTMLPGTAGRQRYIYLSTGGLMPSVLPSRPGASRALPSRLRWRVLWGALLLLLLGVSPGWAGRTAFDDDYIHCPSRLRLPALAAVQVRHSEERDLIVEWQPPAHRNFTAMVTARLTGAGFRDTQRALLGADTLRFPAPDLAAPEW